MTLKEKTKQKIEDTKELILQMIPTRTSDLIDDTNYNYGYLDSNLILHLLNVNATLSSTQTIVSNGSTMTISALVTDSDGNTISNAPVQFYINGTASGNPINTNSNGIATYTYSGTGIGKIKVYAKVGTFQSEPYRTLDCIQYDSCTTGTVNSNWLNSSAFTSVSSDSTGMTVINNTSAQQQLIWNKQGTSSDQRDWDYPLCIEWEILEIAGDVYLMCRSESTSNAPRFSNYGVGKHRIEVTDSSMKYFFEDELQLSYDYDNTLFAIRFHANASSNFKLKDFKVYPI